MPGHESPRPPGTARGPAAALRPRHTPRDPRAAVLFLHGGSDTGRAVSRPWYPAPLRMRPFVRAVAATVPGDVLLAEVRYRVRGWNGTDADPVHDTRRALRELTGLAGGDLPVVLVGHSMGGRAALRAADAPEVRGVVALAPWCPEGEPVAHLRDKDVVVLHGDHDRVTDPRASAAFVRRARESGARAAMRTVPGGDHAMLRRAGHWHRTTAAAVAALLTSGRTTA